MLNTDEKGKFLTYRDTEIMSEAASFLIKAEQLCDEKGCSMEEALKALELAQQENTNNILGALVHSMK